MKHNNIHIIGIKRGEEREQGIKNPFEKIITENFHNLEKEKDTQAQGVQEIQNKMNHPKRPMSRHIKIKMPKFKDKKRILKTASKTVGLQEKSS